MNDPIEATELERVADWRIRKLGENPADRESAAAAELLQKLAADVRRLHGAAIYVELARKFAPQGAHYLENHRGHLMFVKPEERPFVTAELIRRTTFTATERELKERIAELADAGYTEIVLQIVPGQEHAIEDWGRIRRAFA